jgi:hypothetical protein
LKGNLEALLKKGGCEKYTTKLLAEAARLFAGSHPHVNTVMEGYGKISSQGGYVFTTEGYDTVGGDLFCSGAIFWHSVIASERNLRTQHLTP